MNNVYIVDAYILTALGKSLDETWNEIINSKSGVSDIVRFSTEKVMYHKAACISELDSLVAGKRIFMMLDCIADGIRNIPKNTYTIWTGIKGNVDFIENLASTNRDEGFISPKTYRTYFCDKAGIENYGIEINAACASSTVGIAIAAEMIKREEVEFVLVFGADIVSRFTFMGFSALKALTPNICMPFDKNRDGLVLGDGAGAILLASEKAVLSRALTPLAKISGTAITNDATHITAPAKNGCGLIAAIKKACRSASIKESQIDAFCSHGTGTQYNDAMELVAVENVFKERTLPIFSIKAAIGHTLGAAGAIETAICIKTLLKKIIPPTLNLLKPEQCAIGKVSSIAQPLRGKILLKTNSGFGGVNCALILETV